MTFQKGVVTNPKGRPKGSVSPKTVAMNRIFKVMAKHADMFEKELSGVAKKQILGFYLKFVKDIQPKSIEITGEDGGPIETINVIIPEGFKP